MVTLHRSRVQTCIALPDPVSGASKDFRGKNLQWPLRDFSEVSFHFKAFVNQKNVAERTILSIEIIGKPLTS